eukprot:Lithocolla_globosa_v1_NODE_19_length_9697_cov_21.310620.p5 type:complete len:270 gc:universal NODE_19_length_9697_cov_21.310620:1082-1891(+)
MNYISSQQIVYVDSVNKINANDAHTDFSVRLDIDNDQEFDKVSLLDCTIPKSNYTINSTNNTFTVEENSIQRTVTIPIGNYSRKSFKNVLQSELGTPASGYSNYVVSYDSSSSSGDTGKYTFTVTNPSNPEVIFIFTTGLTDQMGFNTNTSYTFSSNTLMSANVSNFRPKITYFLNSNICQNRGNSTLQNIVANSNDFDYIYYNNPQPYEYYKDFAKTFSNTYWFRLLDEDGNVVDLNGLNIVFTIMLWKENRISNLIRGYIKWKTLGG